MKTLIIQKPHPKWEKMSRDKLPVEKGVYNDALSLTLFPSLC